MDTHLADITHAIQPAVAPAFVLVCLVVVCAFLRA
jgi:hypothetical protein